MNFSALTQATASQSFTKAADTVLPYPGGYSGRGIVIPGGGATYFPSAWICIAMLRELGCSLPIELWHLGSEEITDEMRQMLQRHQVDCVDALQIEPIAYGKPQGGWQLKPFAILHSRFQEVLLLDADNFPLVDPEFLFRIPQFKEHGAIFWPDYGRFPPDHPVWSLTGVTYRDEPEFESGQVVVDKARCWKLLILTHWMNQESEFWYRYTYGDKDTFRFAWHKLNQSYAMPPCGIESLPWVMCQHDFEDRRIFQHRNRAKWTLSGFNVRIPRFLKEDRAFYHLEQLRRQWTKPLAEAPASPPIQVAFQLYHSDRIHEAEIYCRTLLADSPTHARAWYLLGLIASRSGNAEAAIEILKRALRLNPDDHEVHNALGIVLGRTERHREAISHFERAVQLSPDWPDAYNNLGVAFEGVEDFDRAVRAYERAIVLSPDFAVAHGHLGNALREMGRFDESVTAYTRALDLNPTLYDARTNLGVSLREMGNVDGSIECFRQVVRESPEHADAHVNLATSLLLTLRYEEGWKEYEWRRRRDLSFWKRTFQQPEWDGADPRGKTILLYTEGGLGNTIQFFRYALELARRGAKVVLECQPPLVPLLRQSAPELQIVAAGDTLPPFDVQAPLVSLPYKLGPPFEPYPILEPYIKADKARGKQWTSQLNVSSALKIGINWKGEPATRYGRHRSIPLAAFKPLSELRNVQLVSLRKGPPEEADFAITWLDGLDEDNGAFLDTSAVMQMLDLIVTCDTATAHLGGAMFIPTWVLLREVPDWRWLLESPHCPWYPSLRLFRQPCGSEWGSVMEQILNQLQVSYTK